MPRSRSPGSGRGRQTPEHADAGRWSSGPPIDVSAMPHFERQQRKDPPAQVFLAGRGAASGCPRCTPGGSSGARTFAIEQDLRRAAVELAPNHFATGTGKPLLAIDDVERQLRSPSPSSGGVCPGCRWRRVTIRQGGRELQQLVVSSGTRSSSDAAIVILSALMRRSSGATS